MFVKIKLLLSDKTVFRSRRDIDLHKVQQPSLGHVIFGFII